MSACFLREFLACILESCRWVPDEPHSEPLVLSPFFHHSELLCSVSRNALVASLALNRPNQQAPGPTSWVLAVSQKIMCAKLQWPTVRNWETNFRETVDIKTSSAIDPGPIQGHPKSSTCGSN